MVLIDGERSDHLPADDRGLAYGDGLFETMAVADGEALALDRHLERLCLDAPRIGIIPPATEILLKDIENLLETASRGVIKLVLTRGSGGRGYRPATTPRPRRIASLHPWPDALAAAPMDGLKAWICTHRLSRNAATAGIKHLNRLDQVLASSEWPSDEYFEGLMLDTEGFLTEGTRSNLFLIEADGSVVSPALNAAGVHGIVRAAVVAECQASGYRLLMRNVTLRDLEQAREVFVTNSVIGLRSLAEITGHIPAGVLETTIASRLRDALRASRVIA